MTVKSLSEALSGFDTAWICPIMATCSRRANALEAECVNPSALEAAVSMSRWLYHRSKLLYPPMMCPEDDHTRYDCHALECDPERSRMLAANHFAELKIRSEANALAMMTAASQGKAIAPIVPAHENHWLLTNWGVQWWDIASRYRGSMYGGRFTRNSGR